MYICCVQFNMSWTCLQDSYHSLENRGIKSMHITNSPRICSGGYSDWNWPTSGNQAAWFAAVTYANEQGTKHLLNAPKFCMAFTAFITNIDQYICLKENNQSFNAIWKVCVWFLWDWCLFKVKYLNELIRWDIHLEITPDIRHKISHDSAMSFSKWAASDS